MTSREFILKKVKELSDERLKIFPDDFLISCDTNPFNLPSETLIMGNEFFGSYEILTADGSSICQAESLSKAKYIVYADKQQRKEIKIPVNEKDTSAAVKNYEKYLDDILRQMEKEYKTWFPEGKDMHSVINEIFRILNLKRL